MQPGPGLPRKNKGPGLRVPPGLVKVRFAEDRFELRTQSRLWVWFAAALRGRAAVASDGYGHRDSGNGNKDADGPAQAQVRTDWCRARRSASVRLFAQRNQHVQRSLGGRRWSGIISVAHAGHLPGLEKH